MPNNDWSLLANIEEEEKPLWQEAGFSAIDADTWAGALFSIAEAEDWKNNGFDVTDAKAWSAVGFYPDEAKEWSQYFFPHEAKAWADEDFSARSALYWFNDGFVDVYDALTWSNDFDDSTEAAKWRDAGFASYEAWKWNDLVNISIAEAIQLRDAGFDPLEVDEMIVVEDLSIEDILATKSPRNAFVKYADSASAVAEIISKCGMMMGTGIDKDTIRFYVVSQIAELKMSGIEKMAVMGSIEQAMHNLGYEGDIIS